MNGTGLEYMCPTRYFVYIFFNPVFQVSTAKNEINLFNNHILIEAPVTFAPAGAMTPSAEFLLIVYNCTLPKYYCNYPKNLDRQARPRSEAQKAAFDQSLQGLPYIQQYFRHINR